MTSFKLPGPALAALVGIAESMGAAKFGMVAQGDSLRLTAVHDSRIAVVEATLTIEDGPTEPLPLRHDTARFKAESKGFSKVESVEVSIEAPHMVLKAGSRRKRIAMPDARHMESPKFPAISFTAHATVPLVWLRACCEESARADTAEMRLAGGTLSWKAEHEMGGFEDCCAVADAQGDAASFYTPANMLDVLAPAVGDNVAISMADGLPIQFEFGLPGGKAKAVLAQRE